jgi:hypothetical protein
MGWARSGAELPKSCRRVGLVARGHRPGDRISRCLGNRSRPPAEGRYGCCRAGWAPGVFRPPNVPSGSPLPRTNEARPAFRHPAPACPLQPPMVESDNALGEAQGDRLLVDIVVWAERGRGKRTPVITSPLSFDLTGVRFQRRVRLARGPPNPSALSTYHPTVAAGWPNRPGQRD